MKVILAEATLDIRNAIENGDPSLIAQKNLLKHFEGIDHRKDSDEYG